MQFSFLFADRWLSLTTFLCGSQGQTVVSSAIFYFFRTNTTA